MNSQSISRFVAEGDLESFVLAGQVALAGFSLGASLSQEGDMAIEFWDLESGDKHHQMFQAGRFVHWELGAARIEPPLTFVHSKIEVASLLTGLIVDEDALESLRVVTPNDPSPGPPPPLDRATRVAMAEAGPVVSASCASILHFKNTLFGSFSISITVSEGMPEISIGACDEFDVEAELHFPTVLRYMAGDVGLMNMLKGSEIQGEWTQLMLLAGIIESSEFQTALATGRGVYGYFADVSEVLGSVSYRRRLSTAFHGGSVHG